MCDNTDCTLQYNIFNQLDIILRDEFNNDECTWCFDCIRRDRNMIKYISVEDMTEVEINRLTDNPRF